LVRRLRRRYPSELVLLPAGEPTPSILQATYMALRQTYPDVANALRVLRQLVLERLVVLDTEHNAPLHTITQSMTWLAEFCLDQALQEALARVDQRHGAPQTAQGTRAELWVIGMESSVQPS
jgi:glutamate-ammonia-ligase adenylyltransferase